ncbi:hypothetical protein AA309_02720 [Microvirga vignae]|uniref:Uncharacterized protein n=1 Tax=Microvirga vignae TaxID=1225564 RepID=A0A0H1RH41_9HYPH|nr:hypothetical protein [Microvirga vignae]KLK94513.1 hypothetical protein AA309_02720 [Microvirga vignae]
MGIRGSAIVERFKAKGVDLEGFTLYAYAAMQVIAQGAGRRQGRSEARCGQDPFWDDVRHGGQAAEVLKHSPDAAEKRQLRSRREEAEP